MRVETSGGGSSAATILGIVFVALKLTNVIGWSWWWVLAPFWIPLIIFVAVLSVVALVWAAR